MEKELEEIEFNVPDLPKKEKKSNVDNISEQSDSKSANGREHDKGKKDEDDTLVRT